ncbi:MAG: GNAT family N-acetyltransferase [Treponema sp.]|nr:GNAT family N-acetyltransferase [Treponema sp.]
MIKLEKINHSDFMQIVKWNKDTSSDFLQQWAGREYCFPLSIGQIEEKYTTCDVNGEDSSNYSFKILDENKTMIGCIDLLRINYEKKHATVGKFLIGEKENRNKGYGKQIIKEALNIAFNKLNLEKIRLCVYDFNISAINCYESVGFKKVSFYKNTIILKSGERAGTFLMSIKK